MMNRRAFAASSLAALAFLGLARRGWSQEGTTFRNEVPGYGDLLPDPAGLLDLPAGFVHQVISAAGEAMDDGFVAPDHFDGMACFPLDRRRIALVRNHELGPSRHERGPAVTSEAAARLRRSPHFGRDHDGRVLPGGTSTIVYDMRSGRRERQYLSLAGTLVNCAGGPTPWNSWLSCEETVLGEAEVAQAHGWVFDVPAAHRGIVEPVPLRGLGRFKHEAAAIDPRTGIAYLTEDREDSLFYRFIPARRGDLAAPGRLQALAMTEWRGADSRNWTARALAPRSSHAVRWIDLDETHSPADDLRLRGHAAGAAIFARGEGIHRAGRDFYFCCTSGGAARHGQIFRYSPSPREGQPDEARQPAQLHLFVESTDPLVLDYADNVTVAPWGHLIVCEDRAAGEVDHLKGVTPEGRIYTLARLRGDSELAGACFSPDGTTMFVNIYRPGRTLAIRGPWRSVRAG